MTAPTLRTYFLRIALDEIEPEIWRNVSVPSDLTMEQLHLVAQVAMGWLNGHLHEFRKGEARYGTPDEDWPDGRLVDEREVRLDAVLTRKGQKLEYLYDFGDNWAHTITLTEVAKKPCAMPVCLEGEGRCPPEDCGGPWSYETLVAAMRKKPRTEEEREWREHAELVFPDGWDHGAFDIDAINAVLSRGVDALPGNLLEDDEAFGYADDEDEEPIPFPGVNGR